jgi:endonuclease I
MKRFKRSVIAALTLIFCLSANADIPEGYYNSLNGKSSAELKTAVHNITKNMTMSSSYDNTYTALKTYFAQTDHYPNSTQIWDMYASDVYYSAWGSNIHREHSFPKSWWGGLTNVNAYVDLNHLYPAEGNANMAKSNYPLGVVDSAHITFENGVSKVGYAISGQGGGSSMVFEPDDQYKGDFARTYFYMATTYQDYTWAKTYMVAQNTYPTLTPWAVTMLLEWSRNDPVSDKEIDRNEAVYKIQNNRNPFIDFPDLAEYIWGNKKGENFNIYSSSSGTTEPTTPSGTAKLITPVQDQELNFGEVALGKTTTARVRFKGEYLTSNVNVRIYTGDSQLFTINGSNSASIAYSKINDEDGYELSITYTPTAIGDNTSRLLISGGGTSGSIGIALKASCLPVPTLSACTALDASDISSDSYTANWSAPENEDIDYFIVTRTMYLNGKATTQEIETEGTELRIDDFNLYDSESYSVQSVRLGYRSPASNVIYVSHSGVRGITVDTPLAIYSMEGGIRFMCETPHTGVQIFDTTGRCIKRIDQVTKYTDITLPQGVYIITTEQCHRPVKAIVR